MSHIELSQHSILRISDVKTMQLIDLYEKEQCLWNSNAEEYRNRNKRAKAAERIARKMNIPNFEARHVMIKFKNLRNSYCQELKKIANAMTSGIEGLEYKPKVFWFSKMDSFLRPHLNSTARTAALHGNAVYVEVNSTVNVKQELEESEDAEDWPETLQEEYFRNKTSDHSEVKDDVQPPKKRKKESLYNRLKKKHNNKADSPTNDILARVSTHLEKCERKDYFDNFGMYVGSLLRSLPIQQAMELQPKIIGLITSAALNIHESQVSQSDDVEESE